MGRDELLPRLFPALDAGVRRGLEGLDACLDAVFPLPRRFSAALPRDVAELSGLLTYSRSERPPDYLNKPSLLSAYLRYFLPWNVYRLARLLPALPLALKDGDAVTDLGSGPLTLPLALWIARPDLRGFSLEFRCLDRAGAALDAGKRLFTALTGDSDSGSGGPWRIKTIRAGLGSPIRGQRAALVTAIQVLNEVSGGSFRGNAVHGERYADMLISLAAPSGAILAVEPGVPASGELIALLRDALMSRGFPPLAPCPQGHSPQGPCPMLRGKGASGKWCHFAFDTQGAPASLVRLSAAAGIPKERGVLSFLLAGKGAAPSSPPAGIPVRIVSDAFPLPGLGRGRYGCSSKGLVLAAGEGAALDGLEPGTLVYLPEPAETRRDPKSGALMLEVKPCAHCKQRA